jgi:SEC-C motif-containing protein
MCICGHEQIFESCCKPYIDGDKIAQSSETLMRSRYSAYAQGNAKYIFNTYAKDKQAENPVKEIAEFANSCQFIKLEIIDSQDQSNRKRKKSKS